MADGLREARPQRWPALLVLAGVSGMVPIPLFERAHELLEEVAWTARGLLQPPSLEVDARALEATTSLAESSAGVDQAASVRDALDARVVGILARLRQRVLPPKTRGWQRDGRFGVVPVTAAPALGRRDAQELLLLTVAPLPPDEPVFHGEQLIGWTRVRADGSTRIDRLTRAGARTTACAGEPGRREARFLALGDGSATLRMALADGGVELTAGDLAWVLDPPAAPAGAVVREVGGALLGRLVRGELPEGAERDEWRVLPLVAPELLAEVAVRFPPGFPLPSETAVYPFAMVLAANPILDPRRAFTRLGQGREVGLFAGAAVSIGGALCGRVTRSGYGHALVRTVRDPGFRVAALLVQAQQATAFELVVLGVDGTVIEVRPPVGVPWDGALVVTAASPDGCPEGLLIGSLAARDGRCVLVDFREAAPGPVVAWRLSGAWSAPR